jgi:hypothetical protein
MKQRILAIAIAVFIVWIFTLAADGYGASKGGQLLPRQHTSNGDTIFALDSKCSLPAILAQMKDEYKPMAKNGVYRGVYVGDIKGCYVELGGTLIFLFTDGDIYQVPAVEMKREPVPTKPRGVEI